MTCTHCGHTSLSREYTLRFNPANRREREVDLQLCTACVSDISNAPDVELVENRQLSAANPAGR